MKKDVKTQNFNVCRNIFARLVRIIRRYLITFISKKNAHLYTILPGKHLCFYEF